METKDIIQSDYNLGKLTSTSEKYYRMDANVALSLTTAKGPLLLKQTLYTKLAAVVKFTCGV